MSTLDYAHRARNITNHPEINRRMSKRVLLNQYSEEIDRLKKDLFASKTGHGVVLDEDNYNRLIAEHDVRKQELSERITKIRELELKIADVEKSKEQVETKLQQCNSLLAQIQTTLKECQTKLKETEIENHEKKETIENYVETQKVLKEQTEALAKIANQSRKNENILRNEVNSLYAVSNENKIILENLVKMWEYNYNTYKYNVDYLKKQQEYSTQSLLKTIKLAELEQKDANVKIRQHLYSSQETIKTFETKLKTVVDFGSEKLKELSTETNTECFDTLKCIINDLHFLVADVTSTDISTLEQASMESYQRQTIFFQGINTNVILRFR